VRRGIVWWMIAGAFACGTKAEVEPAPPAKAAKTATAPAKSVAETPAAKPSPIEAPAVVRPRTPATLAEAEALAAQVHTDHRVSFYCGCGFTADLRTLSRSCGYKTRADESRAKSVRWTHVVPPRVFGAERSCWTTQACTRDDGSRFGGIECCRAQDPDFAAIDGDLFNLVPAITEVAEDRSDYPFGDVTGEPRLYGACDLEVDAAKGIVEPPTRLRGDIARIHLYMHAAWGDAVPMTPEARTQFEAWHADDPPDAWEIDRAAKIQAIQGFGNPWIAAPAGGGVPAAAEPADAKGAATGKNDTKARADAKAAGQPARTAAVAEPGSAPASAAGSAAESPG
jgi:deoxyribonuclease-1